MKSQKFTTVLLSMAALGVGPSAFGQASALGRGPAHAVVPGPARTGYARPNSWIVNPGKISPFSVISGVGQPSSNCGPSANVCYYTPQNLVTAYTIPFIGTGGVANGGAGMTIAVVDAYYNSQTQADLNSFISAFGLPACSGCLTIVSQTGGSPTAGFDEGWAQETNLDVQIIYSIAPKAHILLVTATDNSFTNLGAADLYAEANANLVTNSWGGGDSSSDSALDTAFYKNTTVPVLFSAGDDGGVLEYPCTSIYVTCVGGTRLITTTFSTRNYESSWGGADTSGGAGGGCSTNEPALAGSAGFSTCGAERGVPDIAALADEYTGFTVYLGSNASGGAAGVYIFGGTSLACPFTTAVVALIDAVRVANSKAVLGPNLNSLWYQAAAAYHYRFFDVTLGTDGVFSAGPGWDLASGLGVPLGPALSAYLLTLP